MVDIIQFTPRKELSAQRNLEAFITLSRDILTTWSAIEGFVWEASEWKTTYRSVRFVNEESCSLHHTIEPRVDQLMHPRFVEVAKAYIRYRHHEAPHKNIAREMTAFRALEFVLRKNMEVPDITKVKLRHFDEAIAVLGRLKAAPFLAAELLRILRNLAAYGIVTNTAQYWTHPYVGKLSWDRTNGSQAPKIIKDNKVADQDALLAIGDVFSRGYIEPLSDQDHLITSLTAVLLSAPSRVGEVIRFRTECLSSDQDKDGDVQYYLRYWVPKIKEYVRKPIPKVMAESALEAIKRLKQITEEGRRLARYFETNPTTFYRHADCPRVPDDQILTREEVARALGFASRKSVEDYIKKWTGARKLTGFTLNSLWAIVLKDHQQSNPYFPYQESIEGTAVLPPKMSESLLCTRRYQFSSDWSASPVLLAPFHRDYYAKRLGAPLGQSHRNRLVMCFFDRHGFESIKLKSHGIRHMLNRLAKQSGVSIETITAWSSRSSYRQTLTYLENDQGEAATTASKLMGMSSDQSAKDPVTSEEAEIYGQGPIHRSRYGLCRRSWRAGACNKFGDCLNCSELLMCKGDKVAAQIVALDRENLVKTYKAAQEAIVRGERSASRWLRVARPQILRLNQLLAILNDPTIEDGSPIELAGTDFNHEQTLINEKAEHANIKIVPRKELVLEYGSDLLACLDELRGERNA
ncbi:integrase [Massilia putida]|uniref:integrase n=1 Tax=Massilia putida TaxID=1141883 RepID=UPI00095276A3|nr:integrase [Massilia putida]